MQKKNNKMTYLSILFFKRLKYKHLKTPITKTPVTRLPINICLKARLNIPDLDAISTFPLRSSGLINPLTVI